MFLADLGVTPSIPSTLIFVAPAGCDGGEVVVIMTAGCGLIRTRTKELYLLTNRRCTVEPIVLLDVVAWDV